MDTTIDNIIGLNMILVEEAQQVADDTGNNDARLSFTPGTANPNCPSLPPFHGSTIVKPDRPFGDPGEEPKYREKPKDTRPRRPLSAYNLFFKSERQKMEGTVAAKWKTLPSSEVYVFEGRARIEKARYYNEIAVWKMRKGATKKAYLKDAALTKKETEQEQALLAASVCDTHNIMVTSGDCGVLNQTFDASDLADQSLQKFMKHMEDNMPKQSYGRDASTDQEDSPGPAAMKPLSFSRPASQSSVGLVSTSNWSQVTSNDHPVSSSASVPLHEETHQCLNSYSSSMYEPLPIAYWTTAMAPTLSSSHQSLPSYCSGLSITPSISGEGNTMDNSFSSIWLDIMEADD